MNGFRLDNKVAVVTGGASGIGQAIALCFAEYGAVVRIVDLNGEAAQKTAERISQLGGFSTAHLCDFTDAVQTADVFGKILELSRVDILVNSAGVAHVGKLETTSDEEFERVFRVNVLGTHHAMREMVPTMVARGGGVILNWFREVADMDSVLPRPGSRTELHQILHRIVGPRDSKHAWRSSLLR
jgi:2-keto-3-deoxy-L-fuconate dehydrogenase